MVALQPAPQTELRSDRAPSRLPDLDRSVQAPSPGDAPAAPDPAPADPPAAPYPAPAPPEEQPPAPDPEAEVLALVNHQRAQNGCGDLEWHDGLADVARAHSADMAARDYFSHTTPEGVDSFERAEAAGLSARAENIAAGQPTPSAVMDTWMNSAGHRANILDCSLGSLGVGVATGGSYGIYWTQLFA